jgi:hypothetical protein
MIFNTYKTAYMGLFKADVIGIVKEILRKLNKYI